jgi:hypothetical protein
LLLTLAKECLTVLLWNTKVVRYLAQGHPEFLAQFQKISKMNSPGDKKTGKRSFF